MKMTKEDYTEALKALIAKAEDDDIFIATGTCCSCLTWIEVYEAHKFEDLIKVEA